MPFKTLSELISVLLGCAVDEGVRLSAQADAPSPQPSPTRGEGAINQGTSGNGEGARLP